MSNAIRDASNQSHICISALGIDTLGLSHPSHGLL